MAIHKTDDGIYCISSHRVWIPGTYDSKRAARYAFRFSNEQLQQLQDKIAPAPITFEMLQDLRKEEKVKQQRGFAFAFIGKTVEEK